MEASPDDGHGPRRSSRGVVRSELSEAEPMPLGWTDEKHSQYIKVMEASFMNQLYASMELPGWRSDKEDLSDVPFRGHDKCICLPPGQFKVQRGGCWKRINFEGPYLTRKISTKSNVLLTSSRVRSLRSTSGHRGLAAASNFCKVGSSTNHPTRAKGQKAFPSYPDVKLKRHHASVSYLLGQALVGNNAEASDQNFADDDLGITDQDGSCSVKRAKTLATDAHCNDQVVPFSEAALNRDNPSGKQSSSSIYTASN